MTVYIAFVSTSELRRDSIELLKHIDARSTASQADLMTRIITNFTDEILKVFFLDMTDLLALSPFMEKVVTGSVSTIKSTIHSVSRTVIHKLDNKQLIPLSDYIGSVMLTATDADGVEKPCVGFPISDVTQQRLQKLVTAMSGPDAKTHIPELTAMLNEITDLALEAYLLTPIELLKLGFILRKLAEGSVSIIRGAIHMVIRRMVPDLTDEQLLAVARYLDNLVLRNGRAYR